MKIFAKVQFGEQSAGAVHHIQINSEWCSRTPRSRSLESREPTRACCAGERYLSVKPTCLIISLGATRALSRARWKRPYRELEG